MLLSATPAFAVSDVGRSVDFFTATLGLEVVHADAGGAMLRRGPVSLSLWLADGAAKGAERELAGSVSCRIEVAGIDALHARCETRGCVHPNGPLAQTAWQTTEFSILDPDGNLVTF